MAFETHSAVKFNEQKPERLPKCYKDVEKILKIVKSCSSNLKTALYNSRHRGAHFKKVYALSFSVLKHANILEKIIDDTKLLEKERFSSKEIVAIMIYELTLGKGTIPGKNFQACNLMKYYDDILIAFKKFQGTSAKTDVCISSDVHCLPRYARINTLVTTVPYVLKDLKEIGFEEVTYADDISENEYLNILKNLQSPKFVVDLQFKDLLVFSGKENLTNLPLYEKGHLLRQDKSSYIPVHVLDPEPGSIVIDACAAPGMKTMHLAAKMKNKGTLYAYERCSDRFKMLLNMLQHGNVKIAKTFCQDFKKVNPSDEINSSVDYILLDPSCSGSGMVSRMDSVTDIKDSKNAMRLQKLAGFQIILLKHALRFPSVKRVVYSTCSITEEENEYVIQEALNCFRSSFRLVHIMPEWPVRGSQNYEWGHMCVRAYPEKNLTNGFFVAMFERIEDNLGHNSLSQKQCAEGATKKKNKKKNRQIESHGLSKLESSNVENIKETCLNLEFSGNNSTDSKFELQVKKVIKRKRKKKKQRQGNILSNDILKIDNNDETSLASKDNIKTNSEDTITVSSQHCKKRKKNKKDKSCFTDDTSGLPRNSNIEVSSIEQPNKKRRKQNSTLASN